MPPHDTYIESHFGEGYVFKKKPKALKSYGIEICNETFRNAQKEHKGIELINADIFYSSSVSNEDMEDQSKLEFDRDLQNQT